eukprot:TCONS_00066978-protein
MTGTTTLEKSEEYKKWTKLLKKTTYFSYLLIFLGGLEINAVQISMLYYLEESFKMTPDEVRLNFSVAEAFNALGQLFSGLLIGRYMDRTRNLKLSCLSILCATIVGNLLYSLPVHISFIVIGRFLCGFNEAFQVALCGEYKRCYKEDDLIRVLSWYELCFAIGMAMGPGAPVFFSWVYFKVGGWRVDKYNALHVFLVIVSVLLFIILWFQLTDLSKDLDRMREKYSQNEQTENTCHDDDSEDLHKRQIESDQCSNINKRQKSFATSQKSWKIDNGSTEPPERKLMKWKELLQIDIVSLCTCYTILRYATNASASLIAMNAATLFHWPVSWISWLTITGSGSSFLYITMLIRCGVFNGLKQNYFFYLSSLNVSLILIAVLPLPRIVNMDTYAPQMLYLAFQMLAKGWAYFIVHSSGKILLFNTVTPENSCLIDSIRSTFGSLARLFAYSTSFLCFNYPEFFFLPAGTILFIGNCVVVYRYKVHMYKRKKIL